MEEIPGKIEKNLAALKEAEREIERFKNQQTKDALGNLLKNVREKNGISFFGAIVPAANMDELRKAADIVKGKLPRGAFILGAAAGEKVNLVGRASEEAVKTGIHMVSGETILVKREVEEGGNTQAAMVLNAVYTALKEAGHNPTVQLVGYLVSGEPTYITSKHDARKLVSSIERDELVEELVRFYVTHKGL